jgi:hypothetical protein
MRGVDVELFVNGAQMVAEGVNGDTELIGDFLVEITFGKQGQHLLLARSQFLDSAARLVSNPGLFYDEPAFLW